MRVLSSAHPKYPPACVSRAPKIVSRARPKSLLTQCARPRPPTRNKHKKMWLEARTQPPSPRIRYLPLRHMPVLCYLKERYSKYVYTNNWKNKKYNNVWINIPLKQDLHIWYIKTVKLTSKLKMEQLSWLVVPTPLSASELAIWNLHALHGCSIGTVMLTWQAKKWICCSLTLVMHERILFC